MELIVTEEFRKAAKVAGACRLPALGTALADLTNDQLQWFESHCPNEAKAASATITKSLGAKGLVPLSITGSGDGSGDGSGSGYGYGYGYGYGDGSGYGSSQV